MRGMAAAHLDVKLFKNIWMLTTAYARYKSKRFLLRRDEQSPCGNTKTKTVLFVLLAAGHLE